jgi:hypothetical protein
VAAFSGHSCMSVLLPLLLLLLLLLLLHRQLRVV